MKLLLKNELREGSNEEEDDDEEANEKPSPTNGLQIHITSDSVDNDEESH